MSTKKRTADTVVINSFGDLKKIIRRKGTAKALKPKAEKKDSVLSDEELFVETMKDVQEIGEFRDFPVYQKRVSPGFGKKSTDREVLDTLKDLSMGLRGINLSLTQEYVQWIDRDYSLEIIGDLHRGNYSVQGCLDLHGANVEEAEEDIEKFIKNSVMEGLRCIKIIHGRGLCSPKGPVLKDVVAKRLSGRYRKYVAAFVTARQCDGGLGALYILLK